VRTPSSRDAEVSGPPKLAESAVAAPELVAPAGSWEALLAGLEAGADAFYLGLRSWSARGRAKNFSLEDLAKLVPLVHREGRRVYVALNILLREAEVPAVLDAVWELACLGVDGLIVQDLGLWRACRESFPELPLHASTQMVVHNSAGVRQLARMGFARGVLARECTLEELRAMRRASSLPLEVFVHGALCYSVSGLCQASTALTGRSANRGWCAQPCRWGYRCDRGERFPFSPSDLSALGQVPELAAAGVAALKIEGRLKGAEYVDAVVRAYRLVLDAGPSAREAACREAEELLRAAPGRPATEGFLSDPRPPAVLREGGRPDLGAPVGRVTGWEAGQAVLTTSVALRRGDRIRIRTGPRGEGVALPLRSFSRQGRGGRVRVPCPTRVRPGDAVYRLKTAAGEALEQRLARRLRTEKGPAGLPLRVVVAETPDGLELVARCGPVRASALVSGPFFPAESHALDRDTLAKHLGRLGGTGYFLADLRVEGGIPPVLIPPSAFKDVRRRLVAAVEDARAAEGAGRKQRAAALRTAATAGGGAGSGLGWTRVETAAGLRAALEEADGPVVALLTRETMAAARGMPPGRVWWEVPPWIGEADLPEYRSALETLGADGPFGLFATNLGHFILAEGLPARLVGGRELNILNGWAAAALGDLGFEAFVPSPETDRENLEALASVGWPLRPIVLIRGRLPLFVTRLDPGEVLPPDGVVEALDGRRLHWEPAPAPLGQPWARVFGEQVFSWLRRREELRGMGIVDFLSDLDAGGGDVADPGFGRETASVSGATELNYDRELR